LLQFHCCNFIAAISLLPFYRYGFSGALAPIMNIFVVEDSSLLRERLIRTLSSISGVQVTGYSETAEEAIQQIHQLNPDTIILDIRLKQGTGYQVLQAVKTRGKPPLVIVLTNFAYPQYRNKYLEAGADYFFDKSNEFDQVVLVLKDRIKKEPPTKPKLDA
jgi:DNA-binding NarL/FixJ family response regulator